MDNSSLLSDTLPRRKSARASIATTQSEIVAKTWKPRLLHLPALALVLLFTLGCILLLEVAARTLPQTFTEVVTVTSTMSPAGFASTRLYRKQQTLQALPVTGGYATFDATQVISVSTLKPTTTPPYPTPVSTPPVITPQSTSSLLSKSTSTRSVPTSPTPLSTYSTPSTSRSATTSSAQAYPASSSSLHTSSSDTCSTTTTKSAIATSSVRTSTTTSSSVSYAPYTSSVRSTSTSSSSTSTSSSSSVIASAVGAVGDIVISTSLVTHYPIWASIVAAYVPVATMQLYKLLWDALYNSVHVVAPFLPMLSSRGAGAEVLLINYLSPTLLANPFTTWPIALITLAYTVTLSLGPLAAESLFTDTIYCLHGAPTNASNPCPPQLGDNTRTIRLLQGVLALLGLLCIGLMWTFRHKRKTGISEDPTSISGLALVAQHPELIKLCQQLPQHSRKSMEQQLNSRRLGLGLYSTPPSSFKYGIFPIRQMSDGIYDADAALHYPSANSYSTYTTQAKKTFTLDRILDPIFALLLLSLLGVLTAYAALWDHSSLHDFFSSEHWGPRFMLVACGTLVSLQWSRLHNQIHIISIWSRLKKGNASAHDAIMVTKPCLPLLAIVPSLRRGDWMTSLTATMATASELLSIVLARVPCGSGERADEAQVCLFVAIGVLGFMALALPGIAWWRMHAVTLPVSPESVAAVLSYVAGGALMEETAGEGENGYVGHEVEKSDLRVKNWCLRKDMAKDGTSRWLVDEDEGGGEEVRYTMD